MRHPKVYDSMLDLVGETPMIRLHKITQGLAPEVYAKLEFFNPMGSIKDRVAVHMIRKATKQAGFTRAISSWKTRRGTPPWASPWWPSKGGTD